MEENKNIKNQKDKELVKHSVDSSNLEWVAYDKDKEELYIKFKNGGTYAYYNVPQDIFDGLLNAGSKGRYFWIKIRDIYEYKKL